MAEQLWWVDPSGTEYPLIDPPRTALLYGRTGIFMPPMSHIEDPVPLMPGARLRRVQVGVRELDIPVQITSADAAALRQDVRAWLRRLDPQRGDGKLKSQAADGTYREIVCRYADGMQGEESDGPSGPYWLTAVWAFRAVDPYWQDAADTTLTFTTSSVGAFLAAPIFPLRIAASNVIGTSVVTNDGDAEAWPVWTITGPATSVTLTNQTTGAQLTLTTSIGVAEQVVIDTRPFVKTVKKGAANLYGSLDPASTLWQLQPGQNTVSVSTAGSTSATVATLAYRRKWLSA
jgi:phage-related protein